MVNDCVKSLGSLRCGVVAGRRSVVLRVSMLVRSWRSDAYCALFVWESGLYCLRVSYV